MGKRDVRKWVWTGLTLGLLGFAGGCSHRSLVGTWKVSGGALTRDNATATVDFHNDGTATLVLLVSKPTASKPIEMKIQFDANYTLKNDVLTVNFQKAHMHAVDPAIDKRFSDARGRIEKDALSNAQHGAHSDKIAWVDDNQFISKEAQGVVLYERVSGK